MAGLHITYGRASALPLPVLLASIPSLPRPMLARLVDRMIDRMDDMDPDADLEPSGDEIDTSDGEDEELTQPHSIGDAHGPGCLFSDPGEDDDDDRCLAGDDMIDACRSSDLA